MEPSDIPSTEQFSRSSGNIPYTEQVSQAPFVEIENLTPEGEAVSRSGAAGPVVTLRAVMSKDAFFQFFGDSFEIAGQMPVMLGAMRGRLDGQPLVSLIEARGLSCARPASDALYNICERVTLLGFLIEEGNQWLPGMMALAVFGSQVTMNVRAELRDRKVPSVAA